MLQPEVVEVEHEAVVLEVEVQELDVEAVDAVVVVAAVVDVQLAEEKQAWNFFSIGGCLSVFL